MKNALFYISISIALINCAGETTTIQNTDREQEPKDTVVEAVLVDSIAIVVLGNCQDGGSPHAGCEKDCCKDLFSNPDPDRMVVSLGLIDPFNEQRYIFDASPDLPRQMKYLEKSTDFGFDQQPNGIFITHAHIGHYTGLMHLGREAMNSKEVPVYAMPRMREFLENNGPWNQLVRLQNILLFDLFDGGLQVVNSNLSVKPFKVPHRDEYSETVGFKIIGPSRSALFIPDIDKWEKWDKDIIAEISQVDYAFLDATFYDENELKNRNMSEIPHPFVVESMEKFKDLSDKEKNKIVFIHLNHTNPMLDPNSEASKNVRANGFKIARKGDVFHL